MDTAAAFLGRHRQLENVPAKGAAEESSGGRHSGGASCALRSSHDSGSGSGCSSPKRVSFAPTPPALRTGSGSTGSLLELSGTSPRLRRTRSVAAAEAEAAAALAAADGGLLFIPEVDSPRHRRHLFSPMNAPPLCRRWPSNEALGASAEEIDQQVDMSDLPPGLTGYYRGAAEDASGLPSGAALAHALLDLLPLQRGPRPQLSAEEQGQGQGQEQEQREAGKQEEQGGSQQAFQALPPAPASVSARLRTLLGRLLAAAGASGSSVADLAATTSGALTASASASWSGSVDTLCTARSASASELQLYGSAGSSSLSEELEEDTEAASGEQYRWGDCTSSGFGCTPDPAWA